LFVSVVIKAALAAFVYFCCRLDRHNPGAGWREAADWKKITVLLNSAKRSGESGMAYP
jgi:hypothetical protein